MRLHYTFPEIRHIDQIKEAIEGHDEFYIAEREFGFVCNYMVQLPTSFVPIDGSDQHQWDLAYLRRECRGIMFDHDGKVIARRFHKFFNIGEKTETFPEMIDWKRQYYFMDKLDGSMITPIPMPDGRIRWGTKMGLTDVAIPVEQFVERNPLYVKYAHICSAIGVTPIFEWCSRKQRIVIDYPQDSLTLLAVRKNTTGWYMSIDGLRDHSRRYGIPLVDIESISFDTADHYQQWYDFVMPSKEGIEGYVLRFSDGHIAKIKTPWYKRLHKAKEDLVHEKNVVEMLVREQVDDLKDALLDEDRIKLEEYEKAFMEGLINQHNRIQFAYDFIRKKYPTKKDYALDTSNDPRYRSLVFKMWNSPGELSLMDFIKQMILANVSSQSKVDSIRWMWGGVKWNYGSTIEDQE